MADKNIISGRYLRNICVVTVVNIFDMVFIQSVYFHRRLVIFTREFESRYGVEKKITSCSVHISQICVVRTKQSNALFIEGCCCPYMPPKYVFLGCSAVTVDNIEELKPLKLFNVMIRIDSIERRYRTARTAGCILVTGFPPHARTKCHMAVDAEKNCEKVSLYYHFGALNSIA